MLKDNYNDIHWFDGMPLLSQHMQQMQMQNYKYRQYFSEFLPNMYGVIDISLEFAFLDQNIVRLKQIECIMPDLSIVKHNQELSITLDTHKSGFIHLCVNKEYAIGDDKRYIQAECNIADLNDSDNRANIFVLQDRCFLSLKDSEVYFCMPIAKYTYTGGAYAIESYDPPSLRLSKLKLSHDAIKNLLQEMRSLMQDISFNDRIKGRDRNSLQIYFKALIKIEQFMHMHPMYIYNILLDLCIDLCSDTHDNAICNNFRYNHNDIYASFNSMIVYINAKIHKDRIKYSMANSKFIMENNKFKLNLSDHNCRALTLKLLFTKSANHEMWINNALISHEADVINHQIKRSSGYDRIIKSIAKDDIYYNSIHLQISINKGITDLVLINNLDSADMPSEIYLLKLEE